MIDLPTFPTKLGCDPQVAVPTITCGQSDDLSCQSLCIISLSWPEPLSRSNLIQYPAGTTLTDSNHGHNMLYCLASLCTRSEVSQGSSFNFELSSDKSANSFFSRAFSFSNSLILLAWPMRNPLYSSRQR
jgi:hypothetical protein